MLNANVRVESMLHRPDGGGSAGTYPASCASCARMTDNKLLFCRNSHTAG